MPESDSFIVLRTKGRMEVNNERVIEGMWPENWEQFRRCEMLRYAKNKESGGSAVS